MIFRWFSYCVATGDVYVAELGLIKQRWLREVEAAASGFDYYTPPLHPTRHTSTVSPDFAGALSEYIRVQNQRDLPLCFVQWWRPACTQPAHTARHTSGPPADCCGLRQPLLDRMRSCCSAETRSTHLQQGANLNSNHHPLQVELVSKYIWKPPHSGHACS